MAASRSAARSLRVMAGTAIVVLACACESTTVSGLNVRSGPSTASRVVATIDGSGTSVRVECFTRGEAVRGDTVWYRISRPEVGYVTNYYVRTRRNVLESVGEC